MVITPTLSDNLITDDIKLWEADFLTELSRYCNVSSACREAKVARSTAYDHYNASPRFQKLWDAAISVSTDKLREVAIKVATGEFEVDGIDGKKAKLPPNERILMRLLAAHDANYREITRSEVTGKDGGKIETHNTATLEGLDQATADQLIENYVKRKAEQSNQP